MEKDKIEERIEEIISNAFDRLRKVYETHKEYTEASCTITKPNKNESRLVFPAYYENRIKKGTRISEQELRFAFVEEFNNYLNNHHDINWFYSVETPTVDTYSGFSDVPTINRKKGKGGGRSAEFDMVIYDEHLNRICLIEFKANNAEKVDHEKDFLKLNNEIEGDYDTVARYFIEIIKTYTDINEKETDTMSSLMKKFNIKDLQDRIKREMNICLGNKTLIRCYALEGKSSLKNKNTGENISDKFK